jgi:hypothetical protein
MEKSHREVRSWNRFVIRNLSVAPNVMGHRHSFPFERSTVIVRIPNADQADRGHGYDGVASVGARSAVDNEPLEFHISKVDVEVSKPITVLIPSEVLKRPPNAYDLLAEGEQDRLNNTAEQHQLIAERAFDHWMRIVRWVCDDSRIGRDRVESFRSGWGTYLVDAESGAKIWRQTQVLQVSGYRTLRREEWYEIQSRLSVGSLPPVYVERKHDAEESIRLGNYRQSLVDLTIACETFLRSSVLQRLPAELSSKLTVYIEEANIRQYVNRFFPEAIDATANQQFKRLKPDLHSLLDRRNKLVHMGKDDGIDEKLCLRFLKMTQDLFSIIVVP